MAKVFGKCCICGRHDELSFEHVPPSAAFNSSRIFSVRGKDLFDAGLIDPDANQGEQQQRGSGEYTLCNHCNNTTARYGRSYADWALQGARLVTAAKGELELAYPFRVYPLRVVKQVVSMFMSACGPGLRRRTPYLEKFVMDKRQTGLPRHVRIHAGLTMGRFSRSAGITGLIAEGKTHVFAEVAFRPFVFIMSLNSACPEPRMLDISSFAQHHFDEEHFLYLRLPLLDVRSQFPSDFRDEDEILRAAAANDAMMQSGSADRGGA